MSRLRFHWFERRRDGAIGLRLLTPEVATLVQLLADLRDLLAHADTEDAAYRRLFPNAYLDPTEEAAEQAYSALAHSHLLTARLEQIDLLTGLLGAASAPRRGDDAVELRLDDDQGALMMGVLNDVRLALGAAIGVADDDPESPDGDDDPARYLYGALTNLQGELIEILLHELPASGIDTVPGETGPPADP